VRRPALILTLLVLGGGVAWGAAPAAAGAPQSMTVVTRDAFVTRIGTFRPSENPRMSAAIRAFGRPTSRRGRGSACTVRWRGIGLKIVFANFGSPGVSTCLSSVGRAQSFVATGERFTTVAGLRPGQPSAQIRALYPETSFERGAWTLVSAVNPFGDGTESPVLRAFTKGGQVASLAGWIGGAGE
jgi:hypothetical protein